MRLDFSQSDNNVDGSFTFEIEIEIWLEKQLTYLAVKLNVFSLKNIFGF